MSGSTNFDNDESYGLIRVDQIDEISPKAPTVRKDAREDQDMAPQNCLVDNSYNMPRQGPFHNMAAPQPMERQTLDVISLGPTRELDALLNQEVQFDEERQHL